MGCNMEYKKLQKPLYWMGFVKGKFTKRKFIEYQVRYPSYLRADDGTVRQVTRYMEEKIGKLHIVGGYSMYAYEDFTKDEEIEFLNKIVKYQNERIKVKQKEIGCIIKERDLVIDLIKEKER